MRLLFPHHFVKAAALAVACLSMACRNPAAPSAGISSSSGPVPEGKVPDGDKPDGDVPDPPPVLPDERLSPIAAEVLRRISVPRVLGNSPVPLSRLVGYQNRFEKVLVDGPAIFGAFRDEIAGARHEVSISTYKWEPDSQAAGLIGDGLKMAQVRHRGGTPLVVRILVSDSEIFVSGRTIDDIYVSQKRWGLDPSKISLQLATYPYGSFGSLHEKLLIVDGRTLIVTGANVEKYHDCPDPWHDTGYLVRGDAARSALSAYDTLWRRKARHWECQERSGFNCRDCEHPRVSRDWLGDGEPVVDRLPVIAVGRNASDTILGNGTRNPQDVAWLTIFERAGDHIHICTPNINDDAFKDALVKAVVRGVRVELLTGWEFNGSASEAPLQGGGNVANAVELRRRVRERAPERSGNLTISWHSTDGEKPMVGNVPGASHVKALTADGLVAMVGSGNMDTQSWNKSHEYNILMDSGSAVQQIEDAFFRQDRERSVPHVVDFFEGNDGTQDPVGSQVTSHDHSVVFDGKPTTNDEARSFAISRTPGGRVLRFFDSPDRDRDDDWLEVIVKRDILEKLIPTFERSFEDDDVRLIYHRNNGLDGKVSSFESSSEPSGPVADFYEGNGGQQNLAASFAFSGGREIDLTGPGLDNDEFRSVVLHDMAAGVSILLYDDPAGNREDDWTLIRVKRAFKQATVASFETDLETDDLSVIHFRNNGLDGKVSKVEFLDPGQGKGILSFYESENATQNKTCDLDVADATYDFTDDDCGCDNDEARSVVLTGVVAGTRIRIYDDRDGGEGDDRAEIRVKRDIHRVVVGSFEANIDNDDLTLTYHRDNGLNGKVSRVEIDVP